MTRSRISAGPSPGRSRSGLASCLAFAAIYAWNAGVGVSGWLSACADDGASKALKALTLSAANSLPLIGSSRGEVAAEFYTVPRASARAGVEPPPPDLADAMERGAAVPVPARAAQPVQDQVAARATPLNLFNLPKQALSGTTCSGTAMEGRHGSGPDGCVVFTGP